MSPADNYDPYIHDLMDPFDTVYASNFVKEFNGVKIAFQVVK